MTLTIEELRGRTTLSVEEAAGLLGGARTWAYRAVSEGTIPTIRVGRKRRVPAEWVRRALMLEATGESEQ